DELVVVLRRLLPLQEQAEGVKAVRLRLAEVLAEMNRREEALDAARRALEVEPHQVAELDRVHQIFSGLRAWADAARALERLADQTGSHDEISAVYEELADELPRGPLAERIYLKLAQIQDEKLDDASAAETSLRKILDFDPTNQVALDRLAQMFARRGAHTEYVVALEQKLETAGSIEERKVILREIARVYDERQQNPEEAASALLRALDLEPDEE